MKTKSIASPIVLRLLAVGILISVAVSCSTKDDPTLAIVGDWKMSGMLYQEGNNPEIDYLSVLVVLTGTCLMDLTLSFRSDGTVASNNPKSCDSSADDLKEEGVVTGGTWSINGNKLSLTGKKGTNEIDYSIDGDVLSMYEVKQKPDRNDPTKTITTKTTLRFKKVG